MSSSLYTNYGCDFDSVFSSGSGSQWLNIYGSNGMDIGQHYLAGSSPFATGFYMHSGQDVNQVLATDGASKFAQIMRTPGGWENQGSYPDGGFDTVMGKWYDKYLSMVDNTDNFTEVGSTDYWSNRVAKGSMARKFYRIVPRTGMPEITGLRITFQHYEFKKADYGARYVARVKGNIWGFILACQSYKNGYINLQMNIYAQTPIGEYLLNSTHWVME